MRRPFKTLLALTLLSLGPFSPSGVRADFAELLAKAPSGANLVVLVNAEKALGSEVGRTEGWRQKHRSSHDPSPLRMPPEAVEFVLAADVDLATLTPRSETAIALLGEDLPVSVVARLTEGKPDEIGGLEALALPRGERLVKFGPKVFGITVPGDRQSTAQWVRDSAGRSEPALSPYLAKAAEYPDRVGTEFILALDLYGAVGKADVRRALNGSKALADAGVDLDAAAEVLASVRGMTLGVRTTDRVFGSLKFDFAKPVEAIASVAKPLIVEVLEEGGVSFTEASEWKGESSESSIRISGEMSVESLRRLLSFLELDAAAIASAGDDNSEVKEKYELQKEASLDYFHGVEKYLHDLTREKGGTSYYSAGVWFNKYAKRIDRLPILNVDPMLVDFGAHIVSQMRDCNEAIKAAGINSSAKGATVYATSYYDTPGYSMFQGSTYEDAAGELRAVESDRRAIRAQERGKSSTTVRGIIRQMQDDLSQIRRDMTLKYQVEF